MVTDDELVAIIEQQQQVIEGLEAELFELRGVLSLVTWTPSPAFQPQGRPVPARYAHLVSPGAAAVGKTVSGQGDTAKAAATLSPGRKGSQRRKVFEAIAIADQGLTDEEIAVIEGINHTASRTRRVELTENGWVEDSGQRRPTAQGNPSIVWVLTEAGRGQP